jgi:hypothetical protein
LSWSTARLAGLPSWSLSISGQLRSSAVLIYLFRDDYTANLALTFDVTGGNLPTVTPSTGWRFVEPIDTLKSSPPWDPADFQRLLQWLRADGFYLFEAGVTNIRTLPAGWAALRPSDR